MAFEFGVFHEFQRRPGQSEAEAFTTAFEQVDAAERWGLDAIWLAEIHMAPERSVCAVPMTIASAIAARTKNIICGRPPPAKGLRSVLAKWSGAVICPALWCGACDRWP
jgi:Luciferase-like monooxygenase